MVKLLQKRKKKTPNKLKSRFDAKFSKPFRDSELNLLGLFAK